MMPQSLMKVDGILCNVWSLLTSYIYIPFGQTFKTLCISNIPCMVYVFYHQLRLLCVLNGSYSLVVVPNRSMHNIVVVGQSST